jgi:hypothetical protein
MHVEWRGPHFKWVVSRGNSILSTGNATCAEAEQAMASHGHGQVLYPVRCSLAPTARCVTDDLDRRAAKS